MDNNEKFKALLDDSYQWPDFYEFKFIIKTEDKSLILEKLVGFTVHQTPSKNGNYTSISARKLMKSTDEIIEVYEDIGTIKGVISL
jgi:putative lipoic acid-binding regulatory protein